jgi:hypothetical protein
VDGQFPPLAKGSFLASHLAVLDAEFRQTTRDASEQFDA